MAVATAVYGGYLPSKIHRVIAGDKLNHNSGHRSPPIFISTNPTHLNLHHLGELYALCNHSCHRFPNSDAAGRVERVDLLKLQTAVTHSAVVVSAFTKPEFVLNQSSSSPEFSNFMGIGGEWIRKVGRITPKNGQLVGFGRAVSDIGLTASIYDVMVHPDLQGRGIGRMIVQKIIRMLTNKGIYDIAALCTDKERLFFRACGFGEDALGSTTMMYTQAPSRESKDEQMISAGRNLLLVPHSKKFS